MKLTENELQNKFIDLETKYAFQEDFISKLQEVVVAQQKTIDKLELEVKMILEKVRDLDNMQEIPNRKPPHW